MGQVNVYDISPFAPSLRSLGPAMVLLNVYMQKKDNLNRVQASKYDVAKALDVSPRTVANWIYKLVKAGLIKYKYSGSARLNPNFAFDGLESDFEKAKIEWESFKSDVPA